MAAVRSSIPSFCPHSDPSSPPRSFLRLSNSRRIGLFNRRDRDSKLMGLKAGVICFAVSQKIVPGSSATFQKEMERLSAKEALLLAFQDAGGFEALVEGKVTDQQRMNVMEKITLLERLNPTPRPTTSPYLEGRWDFEWFGSVSPASSGVRLLLESFPSTLGSLSKIEVLLKDTYAKVTAYVRLLNSVESKLILSSKLSVEGPIRMKEEYFECLLESPAVIEEAVPEQLRGVLGQAVNAVQQLAGPLRDALSSGITVPLGGSFQRMFMISYLDEEILIMRDVYGVPEILTRWDVVPSPVVELGIDYES